MTSQTRPRLWRSLLLIVGLGSAGLVAFAVSAAWASIPDSSGTIHACYATDGGALRVIDTDKGQTCKRREKPLEWTDAPPPPPPTLPDSFVATSLDQNVLDQNIPLGALDLAAGKYQVTAKLQLGNENATTARRVGCELTPANEDGSPGNIGSQPGADSAGLHLAPAGSPGEAGELTFFVSQSLTAEGTVVLSCGTDAGSPTNVFASSISIRAVEVGSITATQFPGPLP